MRWVVAVVVMCVLLVSSCPAKAAVRWRVEDGGNGHFYAIVIDELTWLEARDAAWSSDFMGAAADGHLVTIGNAEELAFLVANFGEQLEALTGCDFCDGAWAGMADDVNEGEWRWIDDTPGIWQDPRHFNEPIQTAYMNWYVPNNEPTDGKFPRSEDYLSIRPSGAYNDFWSDGVLPSYLVEWDSVSIPGDTNGDGRVNLVDLNNVRNHFGDGEILGPRVFGEAFPFNGVVDLGDLNLVRNYFGTTIETAAVPEPTALAHFALLLLLVLVQRRHR